jgi:hypothetical protein
MKVFFTVFLLLSSLTALCQESIRKSYKLKRIINLKGGGVIQLRKEEEVKFDDLTNTEKDSIQRIFVPGKTINYTIERVLPNGKVLVSEKTVLDNDFFKNLKIKKTLTPDELPSSKGFVSFADDKIWVNPNLSGSFENHGLFYYQLGNRQSIDLHFTEITVSALTLPLKYRFKKEEENISEDFTAAVNVNLFVGKTIYGKTKFHYREKVGNITNTSKVTLGGLIGASTVTLDKSNSSASNNPIVDDLKLTKGLASVGVGGTYSYNKINFGLFYGYDFSIGDDSSRWNYNKRPWLGLAIGYSLLPF